jgi:hypothetical protein
VKEAADKVDTLETATTTKSREAGVAKTPADRKKYTDIKRPATKRKPATKQRPVPRKKVATRMRPAIKPGRVMNSESKSVPKNDVTVPQE